jgi:AAA+ superfamily predicted ATPase
MGLSYAKFPFAIVRMEGKPGTGKTVLAKYMARRLKQPPLEVDFAKVASDHLGETEKAINAVFEQANSTEIKTIIMEECDALLFTRSMVDKDTTHMLGFINTLLTCIDKFKVRSIPSLLILTSNHPELLDSALESRVTDVIKLSSPVGLWAEKLWKSKLPECLEPTEEKMDWLASLQMTPREIENWVLQVCRRAVFEKRLPVLEDFK